MSLHFFGQKLHLLDLKGLSGCQIGNARDCVSYSFPCGACEHQISSPDLQIVPYLEGKLNSRFSGIYHSMYNVAGNVCNSDFFVLVALLLMHSLLADNLQTDQASQLQKVLLERQDVGQQERIYS